MVVIVERAVLWFIAKFFAPMTLKLRCNVSIGLEMCKEAIWASNCIFVRLADEGTLFLDIKGLFLGRKSKKFGPSAQAFFRSNFLLMSFPFSFALLIVLHRQAF